MCGLDSDHSLTYLGAVTSHWDPEGPGQTKVCEFQFPILVDQKILRFEISAKIIFD